MSNFFRTVLATLALCLVASTTLAAAPFTMERMLTPPYIFGSGTRSVSLSDDGRFLACGFDKGAEGHRDLWTYNTGTKVWLQHTELWADREARLRREFARDLNKARADWEAAHPKPDPSKDQAAADAAKKEPEKFDEQKRIDDFEKDLKKQREGFGGIGETLFLRDSHVLLFNFEGVIYSLDLDDPQAGVQERLRCESGYWGMSLPPRDTTGRGSHAVLLNSDADLLLWYPVAEEGSVAGRVRQLTSGGGGEAGNTDGYAITPDLRYLAYVSRDYSGTRKTQIPDLLPGDPYTTSSGHIRPGDPSETVRLRIADLSQTPAWTYDVKVPDAPSYTVMNIAWSPLPGANQLLLTTITDNTKEFKAYLIGAPDTDEGEAQVKLVYREKDSAWINESRTNGLWDAMGGLLLMSEKDGQTSLYRLKDKADAPAPPADAPAVPAVAARAAPAAAPPEDMGSHEAELLYCAGTELISCTPLSRSPRVLVQTTLPDPSSRNLALIDLDTKQVTPLFPIKPGWTTLTAVNDAETLFACDTGDERQMSSLALFPLPAYANGATQPPPADTDVRAGIIRDRLRDTNQQDSGWTEWAKTWNVQFIAVPGDAGPVPVKLYLPKNYRKGGKYPLLIWAHGAGYYTTVTRQPGFFELFHPWAADEKGWICAEVDYRGSEGYGRQWRTDVWGKLGHGEVDDLVSVKHQLMRDYGADPRRTVLWGWSYGGYLTLMALGLKPGEFPVGCAVAPVTRWENYHKYFSVCRLGLPADNPKEYEQSSAETYLKDIKDHLLIIHGLRDDNTVFQSIAQYLEQSHELGIDIELDLFPSDSHSISNEHHYVRIYQAIVNFAEANWEK